MPAALDTELLVQAAAVNLGQGQQGITNLTLTCTKQKDGDELSMGLVWRVTELDNGKSSYIIQAGAAAVVNVLPNVDLRT
jgi:hypothetical protein